MVLCNHALSEVENHVVSDTSEKYIMEEFIPVPKELYELVMYKIKKHLPYSIKLYNMAVCAEEGLFPERELYYRTIDDCMDSSAFIMKNVYLESLKEPFHTSYAVVASHTSDLEEVLLMSSIFEWNKPLLFNTIPDYQVDVYQQVAIKKGGCLYVTSSPLWLYRLDDITKLKIPSANDVSVITLTACDAEEVYNMWKLRHLMTLNHLISLLNTGKGIGIILKETGELICWYILNSYGSVGILYTKEEHRNKGYALLAIISLCRKLLEETYLIICVDIEDSNEESKNIFKQLGFTEVFPYYVGRYIPKKMQNQPPFTKYVSNEAVTV